MKLISCDSCGVVLDGDKLPFQEDFYEEDGSVNENKARWNGDDYVAFTKCPCCGDVILQEVRG